MSKKQYVATFHTELSALRTQKAMQRGGLSPRRAPVPRVLSASCGVCVFYEAEEPHLELIDRDFAAVYEMLGEEEYLLVNTGT